MKNLVVFICLSCFLLCHESVYSQIKSEPALHQTTEWEISPAFAFDTICFLNVLTGDSFYLEYYKKDYARFAAKLTPAARAALAHLKRKVKDENKQIVSAFLAPPFSTVAARNLDDLIRNVRDTRQMKANYQKTVYYDEADWRVFEAVRSDLETIFLFLKQIKFENYWRRNILPNIESKIPGIKNKLVKYNVVSEVEKLLHFPLATNIITIHFLYFSRPHGIRVTGIRFLTHIDYPFKTTLQNAIHEMMHPPFNLQGDAELKKALDTLQADQFLMDKVNNHNPSFGYNSFDGLIEEDCVKALEQVIEEKLGMETEARQKWRESDDGIHVFAVALYSFMKQENFDGSKESFRDFLVRLINSGKLSAGKIKPLYDAFYAQ